MSKPITTTPTKENMSLFCISRADIQFREQYLNEERYRAFYEVVGHERLLSVHLRSSQLPKLHLVTVVKKELDLYFPQNK